ncbi:MAG: hypothetical protein WC763_02535 [Candidatus Paceibacterota bacterium]|jgi:hypothetical protein
MPHRSARFLEKDPTPYPVILNRVNKGVEVPRLVFRSNLSFDRSNCVRNPSVSKKGFVIFGRSQEIRVFWHEDREVWSDEEPETHKTLQTKRKTPRREEEIVPSGIIFRDYHPLRED